MKLEKKIRNSVTLKCVVFCLQLFKMEKLRRERMDELVVVIQSRWRCFFARKQYRLKRVAVTIIAAHFKAYSVSTEVIGLTS